jgi:two-component system sensor histidine kinase HydH
VAHELNNPLQAIQNALYLVNLEETLSIQAREDIQVALHESNRMAGLIARLRETYRPSTSEEFNPASVNNLILDVEKLVSTHLRRNEVTLEYDLCPEIPDCQMIQDQIKQVILNICLNAVESMPNGGLLKIRTCNDVDNERIIIEFSDNGAGINPEVLPYIFDPFVTTKDGGTGLGLAITYDIVRRHSGNIDVESTLGKGTIFRVFLPVEQHYL